MTADDWDGVFGSVLGGSNNGGYESGSSNDVEGGYPEQAKVGWVGA